MFIFGVASDVYLMAEQHWTLGSSMSKGNGCSGAQPGNATGLRFLLKVPACAGINLYNLLHPKRKVKVS